MIQRLSVFAPLSFALLAPLQFLAAAPATDTYRASTHDEADRLDEILRAVDRYEYSFSAPAPGVLSAPNRAHGLRTRVIGQTVEVFPRSSSHEDAAGAWRLELSTRAFGREGQIEPVGPPTVRSHENRVELVRPALTEWYVNDASGLEQGWTVPVLPPGPDSAPLVVELELHGLLPRLSADRRSAALVDEFGTLRVRYEKLKVWDARGVRLPAWLSTVEGGIAVTVAAQGAVAPIVIDPLLMSPDWMVESNQANAHLGSSVASAGDVNGDGYDDVVIGALLFDGGFVNEGRAFVFAGSPTGLSATPIWTTSGGQTMAGLGGSVAGAGDVNGDGYDDLIIGAHEYDAGFPAEGRAFLFHGSPSGPSATPDWAASSGQTIAAFGWRVAGAGDVNGDGYDDVIISAPYIADPLGDEGRVYVFHGSPTGLSPTPNWTRKGNQLACVFGRDLDAAGDVNGDGYDDVIIGANLWDVEFSDQGRAFLFLGSPTGLELEPAWTADGVNVNGRFGQAVAGVGDVNGDGYDDVVVGAPLEEAGPLTNEGRAYLFLGSPTGLEPTPAWVATGGLAFATFGFDVSGAGDVNGDGYADFLVSAPAASERFTGEGRVTLYYGSPAGPMDSITSTATGGQANARFGSSVAGAGDVNGDGFDDVIIGAQLWDGGQTNEGAVFVYHGALSDCNGNGIADAEDIASGTSQDCNGNQVPDECDIAAGTSLDDDSNGIPDECECSVAVYCQTAPNSVDPIGALMSHTGSSSLSADDLVLSAGPCPASQPAVFYFGPGQVQFPFGDGWRCVSGAPIYRLPVITTGSGSPTFALDYGTNPGAQIHPGSTWNFQCWYRDPAAGGANFNLSDALEIQFCL